MEEDTRRKKRRFDFLVLSSLYPLAFDRQARFLYSFFFLAFVSGHSVQDFSAQPFTQTRPKLENLICENNYFLKNQYSFRPSSSLPFTLCCFFFYSAFETKRAGHWIGHWIGQM
jgi:hypothetical protein